MSFLCSPEQKGADGSFPRELERTKPYSYSIFSFDAMTMLCVSLKGTGGDLLTFHLPDGRGICKAAAFLYPWLKDRSSWPYRKDVEHFDSLPVRSPGLLFAGLDCERSEYRDLWRTLNPDPTDPEIIRNWSDSSAFVVGLRAPTDCRAILKYALDN